MKKIVIFTIFLLFFSCTFAVEYFKNSETISNEYLQKEFELVEQHPDLEIKAISNNKNNVFTLVIPLDTLGFFYMTNSTSPISTSGTGNLVNIGNLIMNYYALQTNLVLQNMKNFYLVSFYNYTSDEATVELDETVYVNNRILDGHDFSRYSFGDIFAVQSYYGFSVIVVPNDNIDYNYKEFIQKEFTINGITFHPYLSEYVEALYSESRKFGNILKLDY